MKREVWRLLTIAALVFGAALFGFAQTTSNGKLTLKTYVPADSGAVTADMVRAAAASGTQALPVFTFGVRASRDGNFYTGAIVGTSPFRHGNKSTTVPTQIVPVILHFHSVGTSVSKAGVVTIAPGDTTFDPTASDNNCLSAPNNVPVAVFNQSPLFRPADFNFGGTDVGFTQYVDAFQRANFWNVIDRAAYHVRLGPVEVLDPLEIDVPSASGEAIAPGVFGTCSPFGIADISLINSTIVGSFPQLAGPGVNGGTFPIFMLYNSAMSLGDPTKLQNCCAGGFHEAVPSGSTIQTYAPLDFDTTGVFGTSALDTAIASHEVGEWMNDPFINNRTPAWGHTGQVAGCQKNLEVGDPLTGNLAPLIFMPNGFTYHLQELAFFSWFFGQPSIGIHGWFSDNGTFLRDAGPVCQ